MYDDVDKLEEEKRGGDRRKFNKSGVWFIFSIRIGKLDRLKKEYTKESIKLSQTLKYEERP